MLNERKSCTAATATLQCVTSVKFGLLPHSSSRLFWSCFMPLSRCSGACLVPPKAAQCSTPRSCKTPKSINMEHVLLRYACVITCANTGKHCPIPQPTGTHTRSQARMRNFIPRLQLQRVLAGWPDIWSPIAALIWFGCAQRLALALGFQEPAQKTWKHPSNFPP